MGTNIIDRLRADFGQRTLGQLLQERDAAAYEIERLRAELKALREVKFGSIQESERRYEKYKIALVAMRVCTDGNISIRFAKGGAPLWCARIYPRACS